MTKIILIRHGVTDWNAEGKIQGQSDTQLSSEGMYQARMLIAYFPFETIDAIYSSNLQRAMKTAEFIANKFKLEVIPVRELREIDFGNWEGRSFEDVAKEEPAEFKKFFVQPDMLMFKGGESFAEVQSRAMLSLKKIVKFKNFGGVTDFKITSQNPDGTYNYTLEFTDGKASGELMIKTANDLDVIGGNIKEKVISPKTDDNRNQTLLSIIAVISMTTLTIILIPPKFLIKAG